MTTCESRNPESLLLVCNYIFTMYRSSSHTKVSGSKSRSQEQKH